MDSFRRLALFLALGLTVMPAVSAQSSSSTPPISEAAPPAAAATQSDGQLSVQARIKARREQRRAAAIHEAYAHLYEAYSGMGYLRFVPGPGLPPNGSLEKAHEVAWDEGFTRYFDERLGVTLDGRGYYTRAYVGGISNPSDNAITNPAISQYAALLGPTYRFYLQPKYSVSGRVMGGFESGNFSGDLAGGQPASFGLWKDGYAVAASASLIGEFNLTPRVGFRIVPEYYVSTFGSTVQNSLGFTVGISYRFGKQ